MAPSSSSTKKAARLAQKGKGKKVRFQGGTLFPIVILAVLVVGLGTIVYARASVPEDVPPRIDDHWHMAYGFDLCDIDGMAQLSGAEEELNSNQTQFLNPEYQRLGVHSHDDGIIHWHPTTSAATGRSAKFGDFLDVYGVELTNDTLRFPADQLATLDGGQHLAEYIEGETKCGDEDGTLVVAKWNNFTDSGSGTIYTANFTDIAIKEDASVFVVGFIPESMDPSDLEMPPWAPDLPELGAIDGGSQPDDGTFDDEGNFIPNPVTPASDTGSTVPGDSTPGSAPSTDAAGTTTPADEAPTTTPG